METDPGGRPLRRSVYRLLVDEPELSAPVIAQRLDSSDDQVAEEIAELARLGLLRSADDAGQASRALAPETAIATWLREQESLLGWYRQRITAAQNALAELAEHYVPAAGGHRDSIDVRHLANEQETMAVLSEVVSGARVELLSMRPMERLADHGFGADVALDALCRGVPMRMITQPTALRNHAIAGRLEALRQAGGEIRVTPMIPLKYVLVDGRYAFTDHLGEDGLAHGMFLIRNQPLVLLLRGLFEETWSAATSYDGPEQPRPAGDLDGELSEQQRVILRLLASGARDEAIARQLGISDRTLRRIVGELLDRLGAPSRFAAGVLAARHGWLDEPVTPPAR
jgi:DNA-binding CsgD family transcriptional regulator